MVVRRSPTMVSGALHDCALPTIRTMIIFSMSNLPKFDTSKKTHYRPALRAYVPNHNATVEPPLSLSTYRYPLGLSGSEYGLYLLPNHLLVSLLFFFVQKFTWMFAGSWRHKAQPWERQGLPGHFIYNQPRASRGQREGERAGDRELEPRTVLARPNNDAELLRGGGVQGATRVLACLASSNLLHERRWAPDGFCIWPNGVDESKKFKKNSLYSPPAPLRRARRWEASDRELEQAMSAGLEAKIKNQPNVFNCYIIALHYLVMIESICR